MATEKKELKEVVLELLNKIFGIESYEEMLGCMFSKDELKEKEIVRKWKDGGWGDELRKHLKVKDIRSLTPKREIDMREEDVIIIMRGLLKPLGYSVLAVSDTHQKIKKSTYRFFEV